MAALYEKIVVVTRQTELDELVQRFNTPAQARFYLEQGGHAFEAIQSAHDRYRHIVTAVVESLGSQQKVQVIDRSIVPQFTFADDDLVVTIGQDGLVSNTAKYLQGQPMFAINPDPERYDGVLLPFQPTDFAGNLAAAIRGEMNSAEVTLARARSSNGQELLAFNDFFIGARSHVSARYEIAVGGHTE
ncbi:MAG: NAD+ kinase, partial [Pseudomonadota bacterium]